MSVLPHTTIGVLAAFSHVVPLPWDGTLMSSEWPTPAVLGKPLILSQGTCIARPGTEVQRVHLIAEGVVGRFAPGNVLEAARSAGWLLGAVPAITTGKYEAHL